MDAHAPFLCGEESFGTGADHIREKDGLWAFLAWCSILDDGESVRDVLHAHWRTFGRDLYCRYDFENCDSGAATAVIDRLRGLEAADDYHVDEFEYSDPVDKSVASRQGIVVTYPATNERAVFRLSGTGSTGATIRLYLERYIPEPRDEDLQAVPTLALHDLALRLIQLADLRTLVGREEPDVVT